MLPQPHTEVAFLPLVGRHPAHPDTIKTALERGILFPRAAGEDVLIFTADQQLYKVIIDILFHEPLYFKSVIPVLGGMHTLMNFIHATAIIMAGSGMKEVLTGTFGSVDKMLSRKKYPQNFHALRRLWRSCFVMWYRTQKLCCSLASSKCLRLEQAAAELQRCGLTILSRR